MTWDTFFSAEHHQCNLFGVYILCSYNISPELVVFSCINHHKVSSFAQMKSSSDNA